MAAALDRDDRRSIAGMAGFIALLHIIGFGVLVGIVVPARYDLGATGVFGVGVGVLAYTLGMRHAFDADHIAAIDNTTRKLMAGGWAFARPVRKVYYNITITALSVAVALVIGTIELISVLVDQAGIESGPLVAIANIPLDYAGYGIVALFVVSWAVAVAVWRLGRVEQSWSATDAN